jgi:hypothetical protein
MVLAGSAMRGEIAEGKNPRVKRLDQFHDGEWIEPCRRGFVVACCRCGLRHVMDFRVVRGRVQFRASRRRCRKQLDAGKGCA